MEENKKNNKKLPLVITIATMLVCCTVFTVLCAIGLIPIPTGNGKFYSVKTASAIKKSYQVEDEATLRELLLLNEELDIVVTKDIKISEPLIVKGTKTLYGDATISADISGEFRTMYMMEVQVGASLTWDGPTLDSDGSADGINVSQKAELNIKSGTIQYMRDAVYSNGTVTMTGGLIQHVSRNGIIAAFRSKVYVNGGTLYNGGAMLLNVETNGYAEINEGATFKTSRGDTIFNAGELNIYGGTICDTIARAINTEGKLHMEYKGEKKDGYIEMYNIGSIAVRMTSSDDCYISDVHAVNIGTNGVYTTDLRSNGKTTVENCIFENCAIVEGNGMSVSRKVEIKDVTIRNSQGGGLNLRNYSDIKIDGLVIDGTKGNCISVYGELEAKNVTLSNVKSNNVVLWAETEATFTDCVFGQTKRTNIFLTKNTTLNIENVQVQGVQDEGIFAVQCNEGATLNMLGDKNVISGATRVGVCLYKNATLNMEGGKICDINGTANGAAVWVREEGSTFNMHGGTISNNTTTGSSGAVFVANKAVFNMYGGTITGNKAELSGGAIQVQGTMNFSGGTISNNTAGTSGGGINVGNNTKNNIYGKLNMTGGTIENNHAVGNGGGISVSGKTTANISGGTIKNNTSDSIGNGIADNGNLTLSGKVAVAGNDVGLVSRDIILKIKGNTLSKHSASNPLVVTPHFKTKPNQYVVIECDNEAAAATMLNKYVKSGSEVYTLIQNSKKTNQIVVNVNDIDMDLNTTGAETVYVSNFQEFKEAVETTKTKRNIVLGSDIVMESLITVPAGTVVNIRDDGQTRTLTRKEGHTTLFFETWYGTGLVLEGTSEGKLVLDGKTSGKVTLKNVNSLVKVRGTTEITNVAFKNNGNTSATLSGAFVNNEYGSLAVESSSFTNGIAVNGGAIYSTADDMTVKNSVFTNNTAERGGAIYSAKTTTVVEDTTLKNNTAAGSGGAIHNASSGKITLTGTTADAIFEGNKVTGTLEKDNYGGGALCVGTGNAIITGYTFKNNETKNTNGGAIELRSTNTVASITDCTFDTNKTAKEGGAIYLQAKEVTVADSAFTNNESTGQGGAIAARGKKLDITESTFGGANAGNKATGNGGAIFSGSGSNTTITSTKDAAFEGNVSSANGGAICVGSGKVELTGYTFTDNSASNGGAIRLNNDQMVVVITDAVFENNTATEGGAIGNASQHEDGLTVKDSTFNNNAATVDGGAIASRSKKTVVENTTFTNNEAAGQGGAILVNGGTCDVTDSTFEANVATINGGAIYNANSAVLTITGTKDTAIFKENIAHGTSDVADNIRGGGAICIGSGTLTLDGYTFTENEAKNSTGGAVQLNAQASVVSIKNSVFDANTAEGRGGAIYTKAHLTVENSDFTENTSDAEGGAVSAHNQDATFIECDFTSNSAAGNGGAVYNGNTCKLTFTSTKGAMFEANYSGTEDEAGKVTLTGNGGAICIGTGTLNISGYTFNGNSAVDGGAIKLNVENIVATISDSAFENNAASSEGGAIYTESTNATALTITDTSFEENESSGSGGAIFHRQGGTTLTTTAGLEFYKNTAGNSMGGAIYADKETISISGYSFIENSAAQGGGAVRLAGSVTNATFSNCEFTDNKATSGVGGAISNNSTSTVEDAVQITDCSFEGNEANNGGAIHNRVSDLVITGKDATVAVFDENIATANGGAIYTDANAGVVKVSNYTFTKNKATGGNGGAIYTASTITDADKYGLIVEECTFGKINIEAEADDEAAKYLYANTATTGGKYGGAIYITTGNMKVVDSSFYYNKAGHGGAVGSLKANAVTIETTKNAVFEGNKTTGQGGAIRLMGCVTGLIKNYTFNNNSSTAEGGAVEVEKNGMSGSSVEINNCKFDTNNSGTNGGAIRVAGSGFVKLVGSTAEGNISVFTGNSAKNGGALATGGSGTYQISNYAFADNEAENGGAIYTQTALTVSDSTFTENKATGEQGVGGAIWVTNGKTATVTNTSFTGNTAYNGGAVHVGEKVETKDKDGNVTETTYKTGTLKATGCTFTSNTTSKMYGGAIYVMKGSIDIKSSGFTSNTAKYQGGAIWMNSETSGTIDGSTFTNNSTASQSGGAIYKAGELTITNTNFEGNSAGSVAGAINSNAGDITIKNCNFNSNHSASNKNAGAIQVNGGKAIIEVTDDKNYTFSGNYATGGNGGAILVTGTGASLEIKKADGATGTITFTGNSAKNGGAIYVVAGLSLTVGDVKFEENIASASGGAIALEKLTDVDIIDGYFVRNEAANGGAIFSITNNITIQTGNNSGNAKFEGNKAKNGAGGAINFDKPNNYDSAITAQISGYTFVSNTASGNGGALRIEYSNVDIYNCQFGGVGTGNETLGNTAGSNGGAIYVANNSNVDIVGSTDNNTISHFIGNSAATGGAINATGTTYLTVTDYTFTDNSSTSAASANAIYLGANSTTRFKIGGCIFNANQTINRTEGTGYAKTKDNTYNN